MKQYFILLALLFSIGCSEKTSEDNMKRLSFTFEIDTVMVHPGDEIIYLQYGLNSSALSKDQRYLYNFNMDEHLVEVIDLDELVLKQRILFEQEGPNGIGTNWVDDFQYLENDKFLISNFKSVGFFNQNAEKTGELRLRNELFKGDAIEEDEYINSSGIIDESGNFYFSLYQSGFDELRGLAIVDIANNSVKKVPIERLKELEKYSLVFDAGNGMKAANTPSVFLQFHQGKILISNSAMNELMVYRLAGDSLSIIPLKSNLMDNAQSEVKQKNVGSNEELSRLGKERGREVGFGEWVFDPASERHFRFSRQFLKETVKGNEFKLVMTVLDNDFKQIYESDQLPIEKISKAFFKNGKLYIFDNMDDELGFLVLSLSEVWENAGY